MNELVQELDAVIAELKNLSPVTQILNIIDRVEALKTKVSAPIAEAVPSEAPVAPAEPVVEAPVEPVVETPAEAPVETPVEPAGTPAEASVEPSPVGSVEPTV